MRKRPGLRKRGRYWHLEITHSGRTVRQSLETEDETDAARLYDQIRAELWQQKHLNAKPVRYFDEALLKHLQEINGAWMDPWRLQTVRELLTGRALTEITRTAWDDIVTKRDISNSSRNRLTALVSVVMRKAARDWEWIDVAPKFRKYDEPEGRTRWLAYDEAKSLLSAAGYLQDAVLFSLATGLRQGNVYGLKWSWVKDRAIIIPADEFKQRRQHVLPLNRTAQDCIARQLGQHREFVFTRRGEPLTKNGCKGRWYAAVEAAALEDFRWHDLRHTWASWLVQAGVPEAIVEQLGGWQSGKMVRRYAHASVESLRPYAEVLDAVFLGKIQSEPQQLMVVK